MITDMTKPLEERIRETAVFLYSRGVIRPEIGIILGSGLNDFADRINRNVTTAMNILGTVLIFKDIADKYGIGGRIGVCGTNDLIKCVMIPVADDIIRCHARFPQKGNQTFCDDEVSPECGMTNPVFLTEFLGFLQDGVMMLIQILDGLGIAC